MNLWTPAMGWSSSLKVNRVDAESGHHQVTGGDMQQFKTDQEKYDALKTRLRLRIRCIRRTLEARLEPLPSKPKQNHES